MWWKKVDQATFDVDITKPVAFQVGHLGKRYDEWVHQPVTGAPIFFSNPLFEATTKTPWFLVPLVWVPYFSYLIHSALQQGLPPLECASLFCYGVAFWTLVEYLTHRFLFHAKTTSYVANTLHFLFHGCHHKWPMDGYRLVFPPTFATPLIYLFGYLIRLYMQDSVKALAVTAGGGLGYVLYDCCHYALHYAPQKGYMKVLKTKHMDHHYKVHDESYGITTAFWDLVFRTMPRDGRGG